MHHPSKHAFDEPFDSLDCGYKVLTKNIEKTAKKDGEQNPDQIPLLTSRQLNALFSEIRRVKRMHRGENWYLVEVQDSDGDTVKIKL